jgi:hypothetical protein
VASRCITLRELRAYTARTQDQAAGLAAMTQGELSKLERRDDFLLSTLRRYVAALGGTVDVVITLGSSSFHLEGGARAVEETAMDDVAAAIDGLAELADWLPQLVADVPRADARARLPGFGEFSLVEHVWHLRDLEFEAFGVRVRRILDEDCPVLPDFDGARAATDRGYANKTIAPALADLVAARRKHVASLRRLSSAALTRQGELESVGRVTLGALITRWRAHDLGHRIEMSRLAEEFSSRAGGPRPRSRP